MPFPITELLADSEEKFSENPVNRCDGQEQIGPFKPIRNGKLVVITLACLANMNVLNFSRCPDEARSSILRLL
jgi:hypothetical protein